MTKTLAGDTGNRYLKKTNRQDAKKIEADLLVTFKNPSATTNQLLTTIKQNLIFWAAQMPKIPRWFFSVSFFSGLKWECLISSVLNVFFNSRTTWKRDIFRDFWSPYVICIDRCLQYLDTKLASWRRSARHHWRSKFSGGWDTQRCQIEQKQTTKSTVIEYNIANEWYLNRKELNIIESNWIEVK